MTARQIIARFSNALANLMALSLLPSALLCQETEPHIWFSDLESGPRTGGENNEGAYVTIYGKNFGTVQQSSVVKIGAVAATTYKLWSDGKVAFQIPSSAAVGAQDLTIRVNGAESNIVPFTVRKNGRVYCVSRSGSDSNSGTFSKGCWAKVQRAVDVMRPGDIVYVRQGVTEITRDSEGSVGFGRYEESTGSGMPGNPIAVIGYPGEAAQIGHSANFVCSTVKGGDFAGSTCIEGLLSGYRLSNYIVVANLQLRGKDFALKTGGNPAIYAPRSHHWRIIGNDLSCPYSRAYAACLTVSQTDYVYIYGNVIHDSGDQGSDDHGLYLSTDSNHIWVGWNTIANIRGCRGIQVHSSPLNGGGPNDPTGHQQFDIHIHDNIIHDTQCDGIELSTVDPSKGTVEVHNNVIYNAGLGPYNGGGGGYFSCITVSGGYNQPPDGKGVVEVYNNTMYNCGPFAMTAGYGWGGGIVNKGLSPGLTVRIRNNIVEQPANKNQPYWYMEIHGVNCSDTCNLIRGCNNLFWGNGRPAANPNITKVLNIDPGFVDKEHFNFHIASGNPAANLGAYTQPNFAAESCAQGQIESQNPNVSTDSAR